MVPARPHINGFITFLLTPMQQDLGDFDSLALYFGDPSGRIFTIAKFIMDNFINIRFGNVKFQRNFLQFHSSVDFDELINSRCVSVIVCCVLASRPWFILQTCSADFEPRTPLIDLGHRHCMFTVVFHYFSVYYGTFCPLCEQKTDNSSYF
ncbi:hypothetical protein PoB_003769200 [Plakobranchus ocellatus]|uniref:Uncharacterized protein n=1 Tax=Plakobranchus ocellatus TaxID=259542 RepID=A0AAV4AVX8_9GAST|nr:hypothetical protein PoB_003769200 [Plakobranchus ocellatus]